MFSSKFVIFEMTNGKAVAVRPEFVSGVVEMAKAGTAKPSISASCAIHLPFASGPVAVVVGDLPTVVTRLQERKPYEPSDNGA